jgi:hypothetical protein
MKGEMPEKQSSERESDFYFSGRTEAGKVQDLMVELVSGRIPQKFGLDPFMGAGRWQHVTRAFEVNQKRVSRLMELMALKRFTRSPH